MRLRMFLDSSRACQWWRWLRNVHIPFLGGFDPAGDGLPHILQSLFRRVTVGHAARQVGYRRQVTPAVTFGQTLDAHRVFEDHFLTPGCTNIARRLINVDSRSIVLFRGEQPELRGVARGLGKTEMAEGVRGEQPPARRA